MPRGPRKIYDNALLNVTSRGNNKKTIFKKNIDYIIFKNLLLRFATECKIKVYHYCLMPNHIHLTVKISNKESLSKAMHKLQLSYFYHFKKRYKYVGRFWQGRFHSKLIENELYLLTAGLYIEANPVRTKLTKEPSQYRWNSCNSYAYGKKDPIIKLDPYYLSLSDKSTERQRMYREIMQRYLAA
ncbi:MAG: transposase [Candidatus Omnitrophica bacterium]|nr:transposase [Candidatus Omnitrophota bacterium]